MRVIEAEPERNIEKKYSYLHVVLYRSWWKETSTQLVRVIEAEPERKTERNIALPACCVVARLVEGGQHQVCQRHRGPGVQRPVPD